MPEMCFCSLIAADLGRWTMPEMGCRGVISGRETIGGRDSLLSYRTRGAEPAGRLPGAGRRSASSPDPKMAQGSRSCVTRPGLGTED